MLVTVSIIRYPKRFIFFALLAMAVYRLPFWLNKNISFFKLMGSGKNGTFDKQPDWQQWAILAVFKNPHSTTTLETQTHTRQLYGGLIHWWLSFFNCEVYTMLLHPLEGHGLWDKQRPFGDLPRQTNYEGPVCVLTRATIRLKKLKAFWRNVDGVAVQMTNAKGFGGSFGIGEIPYIKQATFSIWESKQAMKDFAYRMHEHSEVIRKTRQGNWYSEELFVRFKPLLTFGTVKGTDPLKGKL